MRRPNIILITWHDLGDWLGCYGHEDVESPFLDRLAADGAVLENHFCTAPQCSPSRASIVTGLMPHTNGVYGLTHRGFDIHRYIPTLAQILKGAGYSTHLFGMQHECRDTEWEGYEEVRTESPSAVYCAAEAEAFLADRRGAERPFFLVIGTKEVHRPFGEEFEPEVLARVKLPAWLPDLDVARKDMAIFYNHVKKADRQMGRIFEALARTGLAEETLVVFTTDHGAGIPRAKLTLCDPGIKTALLMRWPGVIPAGTRATPMLSNVDVLPTLLEFLEIDPPEMRHGRSFRGLLTGGEYTPRSEIYAEMSWHGQYMPMRGIRTERFKYIMNYRPGMPAMVEPGAINRYGEDVIEQHFSEPMPKELLFDLEADPDELTNLAYERDYPVVKKELRVKLMDWLQETGDPLLRGSILCPMPEKANRDMWIEEHGRFRLRVPDYWKSIKP